jgi:hypothetical protein
VGKEKNNMRREINKKMIGFRLSGPRTIFDLGGRKKIIKIVVMREISVVMR